MDVGRLAAALYLLIPLALIGSAAAQGAEVACWNVEDVRAGMKGVGKTVVKGTKIETFRAEVLGVMRNSSPGRDMVLCKLSGCNLEKTGVIAGMSGSPVYIDGKLLGAVAYAWQYGKEPIAGVTPFSQMRDYARRVKNNRLVRLVPSGDPLAKRKPNVAFRSAKGRSSAERKKTMTLTPITTPLCASGFSDGSLELLREQLGGYGMIPVQGGAAGTHLMSKTKRLKLQPGAALCIAMIQGDFDLSGIGTVTHVEGNRVWGWGHPFMGVGKCELPMMTGWVHTIYPRQSLSFKMGSPLHMVGVIDTDSSTCIAGRLGRTADLMPIRMNVHLHKTVKKEFNVRVIRDPSFVSSLVYSSLSNSVDMEGSLPDEMTAKVKVRIDVDGRKPIVIDDVHSGASCAGKRAPRAMYSRVADLVRSLADNKIKPVRIRRIDCTTHVEPRRRSAAITAVQLNAKVYRPGDVIRATVWVRPYKEQPRRVNVDFPLPGDVTEGEHTLYVIDDATRARRQIGDHPRISTPRTIDDLFRNVRLQAGVKRTHVALRWRRAKTGVALDGGSLPKLPASMIHILANSRRTGVQTINDSVIVRHETPWVIQGSETIRFHVRRRTGITPAGE